MLGSVLQLSLPFLTKGIVDAGIMYHDIHVIWLILLGQLCVTIGYTIIDYTRRWILLNISIHINICLIYDFFSKLIKLPISFFDTRRLGDLMQRIEDHSRVNDFLTSQALNIPFSFINIIVFGGVLLYFNTVVFSVFFIGVIISVFWIFSFLRKRKVIDYELFEQQSINQSKMFQFVHSIQEIKLQNCEERRKDEWKRIQNQLFKIQKKSLKLQQRQDAGGLLINELKNIIITIIAANQVIHGNITIGTMLSIQFIIGYLNNPIEQILNSIYFYQDVKLSLERINEIHGAKDENDNKQETGTIDLKNDITLQHVSFKYDKFSPQYTLNNITIKIPRNKITAIVGASGSGKTTLVKLLLGFYKPDEGIIIIGNTDLQEIHLKQWRSLCGVVMQESVLFSESIARNIAIEDGDIDFERVKQAATLANAHDFINKLPLKYETVVGEEGMSLSQGQIQRILIARAIYKNPRFILLDEATNSLDTENERIIVENLKQFYKGRTVVIVAHRLSTVKDADQIIVLDKGIIAEKGNHSTLISHKGHYFNLIRNQLELGT